MLLLKNIILGFLFVIFLIGFVSGELQILSPTNSTDRTINLQSPSVAVAGGVSSVTSSTNCITVSPTTGNVIITFNSSCAGSGSAGNPFDQILNTTSNVTFNEITATGNVTSSSWFNGAFNWIVNSLSSYLLPSFNGTTLTLDFNETILNNTIDNRLIPQNLTNVAFINESNVYIDNTVQDTYNLTIRNNIVGNKIVYQCGLDQTATTSFFSQDGAAMSSTNGIIMRNNGSIISWNINSDLSSIVTNGTLNYDVRIENNFQPNLRLSFPTAVTPIGIHGNSSVISRNLNNFTSGDLIQCSVSFANGFTGQIRNTFGWFEVQYNE
ncbi:MAG TPA: hypothetical protein VGA29_02615 [Ignavibacteriaceae bacterium]